MKNKLSAMFLLILVIFSLALLVYYSFYFISESKTNIIEREFLKEKFHSAQCSANIELVMSMLSKYLQHETEAIPAGYDRKAVVGHLTRSLEMQKPYLTSISRVNKQGKIVFTVPENKMLEGTDISYQQHVKRLLNYQKPVLSDVIMAVQGYAAIVMHAPMFRNGEFDGSIAYLISLDHVIEYFKERYKGAGENDIHWVIAGNGKIIFSKNKRDGDKGFQEFFDRQHPVINIFAQFLSSGKDTEFVFENNGRNYRGFLKIIQLPFGENWSIFSAVNVDDILGSNIYIPFKSLFFVLILLVIILFLIFKLRVLGLIIKDKEILSNLQNNLNRSNRLYKSVITDITSIICRLNSSKKIIFFNKVFFDKFKYKSNRLKGKDIVELFSEEEALELNSKLDDISFEKQIINFEFSYSISGLEFTLYITVRGIYEDKNLIEYQLVGHDISEYKVAADLEKKYHEKLREAEKINALAALASGVAHEFNNVLTAIQGNISLIKLRHGNNADILRMANGMEDQIKKASSVSGRLLDLSREGKYETAEIDMNETVQSLIEGMSNNYDKIDFSLILCEDKAFIRGDRSQIIQAVSNVIVNALNSIKDKGKVSLKTELIEPERDFLYTNSLKYRYYIKITVSDNGEGIDDEIKSKIFDPFFTTKKKGRGLGLASAYGIVKNHGGTIVFQSRKGTGSEFYIYLPSIQE
jgi:PAS domain S-box-containing protein